MFPGNYFDFVFVEARGNIDESVRAFKVWYTRVRLGGLFAGGHSLETKFRYRRSEVSVLEDETQHMKLDKTPRAQHVSCSKTYLTASQHIVMVIILCALPTA